MMKPHIFAAVMDFFATDQPILNKEMESASSDVDGGVCNYFSSVIIVAAFLFLCLLYWHIASNHEKGWDKPELCEAYAMVTCKI